MSEGEERWKGRGGWKYALHGLETSVGRSINIVLVEETVLEGRISIGDALRLKEEWAITCEVFEEATKKET